MEFVHCIIAQQPYGDLAIIRDDRAISYGSVDASVNGAAEWLTAEGVGAGNVVAISLPDAVLHIYVTLALMQIGACQASLDPRLHPSEFNALAERLGVNVLVSDKPLRMPGSVRVLVAPTLDGLRPAGRLLTPSTPVSGESRVMMFHGSGTTGQPKIMALRHRQLFARCANTAPAFTASRGERTLVLQRHTSPSYITRALQCLMQGGCLVEVTQMRSGAGNYFALLANAVDRHEVDHLHATAYHAKGLVDQIDKPAAGVRFRRLKSLLVGASPVSRALRDAVLERVTPNLCINYGTNEAGPMTRASPELLKRYPETVGTAGPLTEIVVLGPKGVPLAPGQEGMIAVRGPCVIDGYEGDEKSTAKAFKGGWFHTGDMGYVTEDGAVHLLGRADDMMIIAGVNVYPAEIERVIEQDLRVKEVAVTAVYSDLGNDRIVAFVVERAPCTATEIIDGCRRALGWKAPQKVFLMKSLPRNFAGKVLRRELVKLVTKGA